MTETFAIVPGGGRTLWFILAFLVVLFAGIGFMLVKTGRGARSARFELSPDGLRVRGDLYGRFIPAADLRADSARVVNLAAERQLAPKWRRFGTAVPGYQSGWFSLNSGEKALVYLTARDRVAYVPTRRGYSLLLSVQDADRFVERVRAIATPDTPSP